MGRDAFELNDAISMEEMGFLFHTRFGLRNMEKAQRPSVENVRVGPLSNNSRVSVRSAPGPSVILPRLADQALRDDHSSGTYDRHQDVPPFT